MLNGSSGLTLAVFLPQSQTNFSPPSSIGVLPLHAEQPRRLKTSIVVKYMSLKSQINSLPFKAEPTSAKTFTASIACIVPIMPAVAPNTPRTCHDISSLSSNLGKTHSKHGVSGGATPDRFPS